MHIVNTSLIVVLVGLSVGSIVTGDHRHQKADQCLREGVFQCREGGNIGVLSEAAFRALVDPRARMLVEHDLKVQSQKAKKASVVVVRDWIEAALQHAAPAAGSQRLSRDLRHASPGDVIKVPLNNRHGRQTGVGLYRVPQPERRTGNDRR